MYIVQLHAPAPFPAPVHVHAPAPAPAPTMHPELILSQQMRAPPFNAH